MPALLGLAQVGRVIEFTFLKRAHPLLSARLATLAHPLGACLVLPPPLPSQCCTAWEMAS